MPGRRKRNIKHVYTTTKIEETKAIWRIANFILLLVMGFIQAELGVSLPETSYLLVIGAILGVDVPSLVRRFLKKG